MSCGVVCGQDSDPTLLWLWCGLTATTRIGPLAWALPYATGAALKRKNKEEEEEVASRVEWALVDERQQG